MDELGDILFGFAVLIIGTSPDVCHLLDFAQRRGKVSQAGAKSMVFCGTSRYFGEEPKKNHSALILLLQLTGWKRRSPTLGEVGLVC
jgi:hypothetical protein